MTSRYDYEQPAEQPPFECGQCVRRKDGDGDTFRVGHVQQSDTDWKIYRDDTALAFYQWARDMELVTFPDQPDGIDTESHDRPDPAKAAERILAYVASFGDGLYDVADGNPLYGRDLEVVAKALAGRVVVDLPEPDADPVWWIANCRVAAAVDVPSMPAVWLDDKDLWCADARRLGAALIAAADRAEQLADEADAAQQDAEEGSSGG